MIERVSIRNFKSFGEPTDLDLGSFCVFIGPNAAGKSNLMDVFRFLRDSLAEGLEMAVARRLGWKSLRCRKRKDRHVSFSIYGKPRDSLSIKLGKRRAVEFSSPRFEYHLVFDADLQVTSEKAFLFAYPADGRDEIEVSSFQRSSDSVHVKEIIPRAAGRTDLKEDEIRVAEANRQRLFLAAPFLSLAGLVILEELQGWRFYDLDPQKARYPSMVQEADFLSETGDNLAVMLHQLRLKSRGDGDLYLRIRSLMQEMVPGFEDWETEQLADGRIGFKIRERGLRGALPSLALSDGTVRLLAILITLLGAGAAPGTVFIEEPERSLHPALMEPLVQVMREASSQIQILVTTHSAELVRYCQPQEVYLVDKVEGCTRIIQVSTVDQIDEFLKVFTLEQLWLQGYLERGV